MPSAPLVPLLHHLSRVPGRGYRCQPPQALHGRGRHTWQPTSPRQTAEFAPRWFCRNQVGLVFRPAGFFTFPSGSAIRWSRNRFLAWRGGFCTPGTGGAITGATDAVVSHQRALPQRLDLRLLLLPAEVRARGEPCGHLLTPLAMVRPVGCTPITLYCTFI
jgi:hypothetical protein